MNRLHPQLLKYEFDDELKAFSTTRNGGVSKGAYTSFNINHYCGDSEVDINQNRRLLCEELHITDDCLVMPHQVHDTKVHVIDQQFMSLPADERKNQLEGVDGLVTSLEGVCIGVSTADCVPILLYNKEHHVAAAVHAGWRGTVARIVQVALKAIHENYNVPPQKISAIIGPSIALKSFEVGDEVFDMFQKAGFPMSMIAEQFPAKAPYTVKWHIDLWEANCLQLLEAGVDREQIQVSGIDTYTRADEFFSARRLGINSGRIFTGILFPSDKK